MMMMMIGMVVVVVEYMTKSDSISTVRIVHRG
jgi:hypothetical protein